MKKKTLLISLASLMSLTLVGVSVAQTGTLSDVFGQNVYADDLSTINVNQNFPSSGTGSFRATNASDHYVDLAYTSVTKSESNLVFAAGGEIHNETAFKGISRFTCSATGGDLYYCYSKSMKTDFIEKKLTSASITLPYECVYLQITNKGTESATVSELTYSYSCSEVNYTGDLVTRTGAFAYSDGVYTATSDGSIGHFQTLTLENGTYTCDVVKSSPAANDAGITFKMTDTYSTTDVNNGTYYVLFHQQNGEAMCGDLHGGWKYIGAEKLLESTVAESTLKVTIKDHTMKMYLNGTCALERYDFDERDNVTIGLRSNLANTTFTNIKVSEYVDTPDANALSSFTVVDQAVTIDTVNKTVTNNGSGMIVMDQTKMIKDNTSYTTIVNPHAGNELGFVFGIDRVAGDARFWESKDYPYYFADLNSAGSYILGHIMPDGTGWKTEMVGSGTKDFNTSATFKLTLSFTDNASKVAFFVNNVKMHSGYFDIGSSVAGKMIGLRAGSNTTKTTHMSYITTSVFDPDDAQIWTRSGGWSYNTTASSLTTNVDGCLAWLDNKQFNAGKGGTYQVDIFLTGYTDASLTRAGIVFGGDKTTTAWNENNYYLYFADAANVVCGCVNNWQTSNVATKSIAGWAQDKTLTFKVSWDGASHVECWLNDVKLKYEMDYDSSHTCTGVNVGVYFQQFSAGNGTCTFSNFVITPNE